MALPPMHIACLATNRKGSTKKLSAVTFDASWTPKRLPSPLHGVRLMEIWNTKLVREAGPSELEGRLCGPREVARATARMLDGAAREQFLAFYLDACRQVIGCQTSPRDRQVTRQLKEAGKVLGIGRCDEAFAKVYPPISLRRTDESRTE